MGRGEALLGLVTITIILLATSFSINANAGEAGVGVLNVSPKFSEIRLVQQDNLIRAYITASDYNFRKFGVNHLLLWQVIKKYAGKQYDFLDLGSTKKGSNLEIFKRGWRGKKLPIYELSSQLAKNRLRDSKLRNVLGFLPSFLTTKLSPYLLKYKL